jgi:Holliday junction resolvase RusA-like endonuclease
VVAVSDVVQPARSQDGTLRFHCPLPPAELHQNARLHHYARNTATQAYRRDVCIYALEAMLLTKTRPFDRARLSLKFIVADRRRRDVANYFGAFKAGIDALVDAGIIPDDDYRHLSIGSVTMEANLGAPPVVLVTLEEIEEATR